MRLDHLLAIDPLGTPLDDSHRENAKAVLESFGFSCSGESYALDDAVPWMIVEEQDGLWRVHVDSPVPEHILRTVEAVCDGLVREGGLVRIDPLWQREISPLEWSQRLARERNLSIRRRMGT